MFFRRRRPESLFRIYKIDVGGGHKRRFHHRKSVADLGVIRQHFHKKEYDLSRLRRGSEIVSLYRRIVEDGLTPVILDCGANIGASAVYFALEFPKARIISFEPDEDNHQLLQINTAGLNITNFRSAVGAESGTAALVDPGEGEWGYRTLADPDGQIAVVGLDAFVSDRLAANEVPLIAKIDIEGGEMGLFEHSLDWIDRFPLLIVELHDWLLPRQGTSRAFLKAMAERDRDFVYIGEDVFSIKN